MRTDFGPRLLCIALFAVSFGPAAAADETLLPLLAYGDTTTNVPKFRTWNGAAWSSAGSTVDVGGSPRWIVARNCPTRNELLLACGDNSNDLNLAVYNGTSWGSLLEVTSNLVTNSERPFHAAYSQLSGTGLALYRNGSGNPLYYRTWDGVTWSGEQSVTTSGTGDAKYVKLLARRGSNEIMAVCLDNNNDLSAMVWNGSAFGNKVLLDGDADYVAQECFDAIYETSSGRCVVAWSPNGSTTPKYRIWTGSAWQSAANMQNIGSNTKQMRLAADPNGNKLIAMTLDSSADVNLMVWNGSNWGSPSEVQTSVPSTDRRGVDVAFEPGGTRALAMYARSSQSTVRYRVYDGSSWTSESTGPDIGQPISVVQLAPAGSGSDILIAIERKNDGALVTMRWNGSSLVDTQTPASDLGGPNGNECYMICDSIPSTLTPANVPYSNTFESSLGAEWAPTTRTYLSNYTNYAGRYHGESLRLALNTTPGETYSVVFDFYPIDSWDGDYHNDTGPDAFSVTAGGVTLFDRTFMHQWITDDTCSYPHPYDAMGAWGYTSHQQDAIYRKVEAVFTATAATTTLDFFATLKDENAAGLDDESWGIDNVSVKAATFVDVSTSTGFGVTSTSGSDNGSGIHWADLDDDGDLDVLLSGSSARQLTSSGAGASFSSTSLGNRIRQYSLWDADNDGDIDAWASCDSSSNAETCLQNNGSASLSSAGALGFTNPTNNEGCAAGDVNGDGWCDVVMFSGNGNCIGHHQGATPAALVGTSGSSYGLNGSGDVGNGEFVSSGDVNNDGFLDFLYHYNSGRLFLSNGDGTYTRNNYNISFTTGNSDKVGSAWGDYDNDGDLDLFIPRLDPGNTGKLFRNDRNWTSGSGSFTDVTSSAGFNLNGVPQNDANLGTRSACWGDYDNDGDLDLFIAGANGNHYLYQNQGNGTFVRTGVGITPHIAAHDCCFVDYDNDGDLDLSLTADNASAVLMRNRTNGSNYLKVRVIGRGGGGTNKAAIGTRVELWNAAGTTRLARRDVGVARGYAGSEPLWLHFGGVTPTSTYTVKVYFKSCPVSSPYSVTCQPSTTSTTIGSTTIPQMLTVTEPPGVRVIHWREVPNPDS